MFYLPWEQTASCQGCVGKEGICGEKAHIAPLQEILTGALIGLARAAETNEDLVTDSINQLFLEGLFATLTGVNVNQEHIFRLLDWIDVEKRMLVGNCYTCMNPCDRTDDYDLAKLWNAEGENRSLRVRILSEIRGAAAYAHYAGAKGYEDHSIYKFLRKALIAVGRDDWQADLLLPIVMEAETVKLRCKSLLDKANNEPLDSRDPAVNGLNE